MTIPFYLVERKEVFEWVSCLFLSYQARYQDIHYSVSWPEFQVAVSSGKNLCHAIGDDQEVVGATGACPSQRVMD
jgi:hypothetical protein